MLTATKPVDTRLRQRWSPQTCRAYHSWHWHLPRSPTTPKPIATDNGLHQWCAAGEVVVSTYYRCCCCRWTPTRPDFTAAAILAAFSLDYSRVLFGGIVTDSQCNSLKWRQLRHRLFYCASFMMYSCLLSWPLMMRFGLRKARLIPSIGSF